MAFSIPQVCSVKELDFELIYQILKTMLYATASLWHIVSVQYFCVNKPIVVEPVFTLGC